MKKQILLFLFILLVNPLLSKDNADKNAWRNQYNIIKDSMIKNLQLTNASPSVLSNLHGPVGYLTDHWWMLKHAPQYKIDRIYFVTSKDGTIQLKTEKPMQEIYWPDPSGNVPYLVKYKYDLKITFENQKKPGSTVSSMKINLMGAIYFDENSDIQPSFFISMKFFSLWRFGFNIGVGYPGFYAGISYRLYKDINLEFGYGYFIGDKNSLSPTIGISTLLF